MREDGLSIATIEKGIERVMTPLIRENFRFYGTELYQPMFTSMLSNPEFDKYYNNDYIKHNSLNWKKGRGKIFLQKKKNLIEYPNSQSNLWLPQQSFVLSDLFENVSITTFKFQTYLDSIALTYEYFSEEEKRHMKNIIAVNKSVNNRLIRLLRNKID
ncbi:MAG TPA: hypothetical protein VM123_08815 [archaeon]|nr:hypothetical protein [archaeon]